MDADIIDPLPFDVASEPAYNNSMALPRHRDFYLCRSQRLDTQAGNQLESATARGGPDNALTDTMPDRHRYRW